MEPDQHVNAEKDDNEIAQHNDNASKNEKCDDEINDDSKKDDEKQPIANENEKSNNIKSSPTIAKEEEENQTSVNDTRSEVDFTANCDDGDKRSDSQVKSNVSTESHESNTINVDAINSKAAVSEKLHVSSSSSAEKKSFEDEQENKNIAKISNGENSNDNNSLPSFPGTIMKMKSVPGSNDVKLEIASSSLLDRVILYSLKNQVVDNSRLDAAKNKYILNNGNTNTAFSNNSNGSDSNSSSKSVDKLIEEFKGNCKSNNENLTPTTSTTIEQPLQVSDFIKDTKNGAETLKNVCNEDKNSNIQMKIEQTLNSPTLNQEKIVSPTTQQHQNSNSENEALDFRDSCVKNSDNIQQETHFTMLDLSVKRDDKSVPPIKRSHALYVGLPDFSKQIFTAPSITRTTNTLSSQSSKAFPSALPEASISTGPPKVRNPDFSNMARAPELQMRHPDFSKGFVNESSSSVQITPSNFPEIIRKNNYVSDLQLKTPNSSTAVSSVSYKIDYRPSTSSQKLPHDQNAESVQQSYPNMKKESINAYNQQQNMVDEPMAHVIHKNQFLPVHKDAMLNNNWNEHRGERLLGGSSHFENSSQIEKRNLIHSGQPSSSQGNIPNEDLRKVHPAHYQSMYKDKDFQHNEFSLKQKEQQLRQEGTIITIKNENSIRTQSKEYPERRSADLFRDYKLKQPKESPDSLRRTNEPPPLAYQQQYPDFPANYQRLPKFENVNVKISPHSPVPQTTLEHQECTPGMRSFHTTSHINVHRQKSPLTSGSMNPPQNWPPPPPLVSQRHAMSPATGSPSVIASPSPTHYQNTISNYPPYTKSSQPYKYPEPSASRQHQHLEVKDSRHKMRSPSQTYYHHKYPDFSRKFDAERINSFQEHHAKYPTNYSPAEVKPPIAIEPSAPLLHRFPSRHDLEIRTIREQSNHSNMMYGQQTEASSSSYYGISERNQSNVQMSFANQEHLMRNQDSSLHYSRVDSEHHPRVPPDLKIEKRVDESNQKMLAPTINHRPSPVAELSIIPRIKTEQTSVNNQASNLLKSAKSVFAEVKRESPLDLSVKTVKTKADSTGCDQDFHSRNRNETTLPFKVEFTPNFSNVSKTECRQQARIGPQEYDSERILHITTDKQVVPLRFLKDQESSRTTVHKTHQASVPTINNRNQHYPAASDNERPHAPLPIVPFYLERGSKQTNVHDQARIPIGMPANQISRTFENTRYDFNYQQNESRIFPLPSNIPYPVKQSLNISEQKIPHMQSSLSKDPHILEREKDRRYVEEILYGRKKEVPFNHQEPRQFQPIPSPPRKRHIDTSQQQMFPTIPAKQSKNDDSTKLYSSNSAHLNNHHYIFNEGVNCDRKDNTPPIHRQENHQQRAVATQNSSSKHYPDPRKDAIKSAEMMTYNTNYYPNPKAEMIHRSDPTFSHKYYTKDTERISYQQNFHQRPDDTIFPMNSRLPHPVPQEIGIKVEQLTPAGPLSENLGESQRQLNGMISFPNTSGSNGNISRGADQITIQKLKSNLEFKEQQKMKIQKNEMGNELELQQCKDLSPRAFRTKGELKGYTVPINVEPNKVAVMETASAQLPSTSALDLFDWGSTCNDFVQQLQTGKKRAKKKRSKNDGKQDEKFPTKMPPGTTTNDLSEIPKEILQSINRDEKSSSSDEDKPLLALKNNITTENVSEKLSRNFREKQRQEVEQKIAARLGRPSSSESETDVRKNSRKIVQRVRRLRKRATLGIRKTDDEVSIADEGEGETDDDNHSKEKLSKSKLDDLTSSDDDINKKNASNDKKCSNDKKSDRKNVKKSQQSNKQEHSSDQTETSSSEEETTEDKISKLSIAKNVKKLKDLGVCSSFKILLEEEETMTRSKRKLENEKKLSNSKILRNEKVVQNVLPDKRTKIEKIEPILKKSQMKRKDSIKSEDSKRKINESESEKDSENHSSKKKQRKLSHIQNSSSDGSDDEVEMEMRTERLRPRKTKLDTEMSSKGASSKRKAMDKDETSENVNSQNSNFKKSQRSLSDILPFREEKTSKFTPGWEAETYNFKRLLKIPPGLITIGRPPQHGISHSLPDLDPQTSDTSEIFSEFVKSKDKEGKKGDAKLDSTKKKQTSGQKKNIPSSIIDLLHRRVIQSKKKFKTSKKNANVNNTSTKSTNDNDTLLPTPEKESEKVFGFKKNIFETFIITSRTRTENNAIRKKEMLKEVFGAAEDERPRSAPPIAKIEDAEEAQDDDDHDDDDDDDDDEDKEKLSETIDKKISYDQKYREYLEKMNVDFLDVRNKLSLSSSSKGTDEFKCDVLIKQEDDDDFDDNETVVVSERDLATSTMKGKTKKNRQRRCKGSSGFDYIRKKKKPSSNTNENPLSVNNIIKKRLAAMENLDTKDENDISKEIKGWVLNKSVGESILHKASRLDYVDVVAYCLDRLNMNADPKDNAGYTPLHEACSRGHLEIARLLLQYGANHSETALSGIRPLHEAIENGHVEIVRLLLSFGADPCLATYSGQLPISMAEDKEMEYFLNSYLIDIDHKEGYKASWYIDGAYKIEDPDEIGYDIFDNVPIVKTDIGSSVASVFSTSMTSLITATTQMSDNETVVSENTAITPIKTLSTPMKAPPMQDLIKYQHKMKKCDTNSNNLVVSDANSTENNRGCLAAGKKTKQCSVLLNNIDLTMKKIKKLPAISKTESPSNETIIRKLDDAHHQKDDYDDMMIDDALESDCEFLELEESDAPLPPLYLLRDEGNDKWILLTDLCNLLKVKSKEAVLKQICPSSPPSANKELIRELKMSDFLEKAMCLQLFCAGEKLNVRASKVSLVRYNESVKNLLGVQTIRMNM